MKKSARGHHHRFPTNRPEGRIAFSSFRPNARICFPKFGQRTESHFSKNRSEARCLPKFCQRAESHFSEIRPEARITFFQNSTRGPNHFFVFKKSARGPNNLFPKIGQRVESHFFKSRPEALLTLLLFFPKLTKGPNIIFQTPARGQNNSFDARATTYCLGIAGYCIYIYVYMYICIYGNHLFVYSLSKFTRRRSTIRALLGRVLA